MLTVLENANLYAPEPLGIHQLLIGGGRLLQISRDRIEAPAEVVDCAGRAVIPGLIDGHAHITGGGGEAGFSTRVPAPFLGDFTSAGVTTVVGVLGTDDTTRDTRSIVAHAYALREEGLGAFCHTGGYHIPPTTLTGSVRDDIVFIDPVIGVGEVAISDHRSSQPTATEIQKLASEAHVAGLITGKAGILHLHLGDGERGLALVNQALDETELPARVFNPTHVNRRRVLFEEALHLARRGCSVDITAFPVEEDEDAWAADDALVRFLEAGAPADRVTISSDGGGCLPVFDDQGSMVKMDIGRSSELGLTLRRLVQRGVPLEQALPAFTSNVASLLRFADRGRLVAGNRADLVILDEETQIHSVMVGGVWHLVAGERRRFGQFEQQPNSQQRI